MTIPDGHFDIFVGSKIGSFKHIQYHQEPTKNTKKCVENLVDVKTLQKGEGITRLVWGNPEQTEILIGRQNQQVQVYDTTQGAFTKDVIADHGAGEVVGLGKYKRRLITALSSGVVKVWSKKESKEVVMQTGGELDALESNPEDTTMFATGGKENELKIWRIGESSPSFSAKNLPHDSLQLRPPVWVSGLCWVSGLVAACSRHGYVRLYDPRAQRRPVATVNFENNMAATCIAPSFGERQVLVGFGRGHLHQVDLRSSRPDKGFKGAAGAITSVAAHNGCVVSTSLDRHCRVHDYATKELKYKQYLTTKLTAVLVQKISSTPLKRGDLDEVKDEVEVKEEDEMDDLFENMETVGERQKKRPLQPNPEETVEVVDEDEAIKKLLRLTEKKKRRVEKVKRDKKKKSVFHNA